MEQNEISLHEIHVIKALRDNPDRWMTNREIAGIAPTVAERTVRAKTAKLVTLGLLDVAEVFPAHRYRWSEKAKQRNTAYLTRIDTAASVFGL